ncbi:cytidine deaminase-like protein [Chaetomium sp. MPI-SDFR-AT-0129]|nr:cytidine deaminase-like protein [Chaetomium sp. MPI-SDFR-AT-0129]
MFIGICGSICAGKRTIARYLVAHHGFTQLYLEPSAYTATYVQIPSEENNSQSKDGVSTPESTPNNTPQDTTPPQHTFSTPEALLEFVTAHWNKRWVTTALPSEAVLDLYARRPFFLLISVDAPLTVRWQRYLIRRNAGEGYLASVSPFPTNLPGTPPTRFVVDSFERFAALSDQQLFDPSKGAHPLLSRASIRLLNTSPSLADLYATLGKLDLLDPNRLRPSWDTYFMALASLAAQRSNCMKRRVGCVVVRDGRVVSTGYNGTPRGLRNCGDGGCGRCNAGGTGSGHGLATCLCIHAEENALLEAGRERLRQGAVLYCDTCPCLTCSIKIVQVGVEEVVYNQGYSMDDQTAAVFQEAGVRLRQFVPPANGLIHLEKPELYT